jgi:hypothetical protein
LFDADGRGLDRFGFLLVLVTAAVTMNSLFDIGSTSTWWGVAGSIGVTLATGLTLIVAMRASGVSRRLQMIATIIVVVTMAIAVIVLLWERIAAADGDIATRPSLAWLILAVFSPLLVSRRVLQHTTVTRQTLLGAIAAFLLIALAFDYSFLWIESVTGTPFFGTLGEPTTSYMYFSLVTITTLGYGDLAAAEPLGRYLSTAEAVIGTVFLVTFVARLVALFGTEKPPSVRAAPEPPPTRRA